ncbi:flagellar hook-length control protein FliK [Niveispirillum fermenti]|uniref:flagellar hook-length control protein FliK n=1 Tax=Niveispirillum fermenti TaxID=1233113 RepID=UPI003A84B3E6
MDIFALPASSAASPTALSIGGAGLTADGLRGDGQEASDRFNQLLANFLNLTGSAGGGSLDAARTDGMENAGGAPMLMAGTALRSPGGGILQNGRPLGEASQRWGQSGLFLMDGGMLAGQEMSEEVTAFLNELATAFKTPEAGEEVEDTDAAGAANGEGDGSAGTPVVADPAAALVMTGAMTQSDAATALALLQGDVTTQPGPGKDVTPAAIDGRPAPVIPTLRPDSIPSRLGTPMPAEGAGLAPGLQAGAAPSSPAPHGQTTAPVIPRVQGMAAGSEGPDTTMATGDPMQPENGTPGVPVTQTIAGTTLETGAPAPGTHMPTSAGPALSATAGHGTATAKHVPGTTDAGMAIPPATATPSDDRADEPAGSTTVMAGETEGTQAPSPVRKEGAHAPSHEAGQPLTVTARPAAAQAEGDVTPATVEIEPAASVDEAETHGVTNQRMLAPLHVKDDAEAADKAGLAGAAQNAGQNQVQPRPDQNGPAPDRTADNLLVRAVGAATDSANSGTAGSDGHPDSGSGMADTADATPTNLHAADPGKAQGPDFAQSLRATTAPHRPGVYMPPTQQMAIQVQRAVQDGTDRLSIQLRPLDLGRIDVQLEIGAEGRLRAKVIAESPQTLEMLQKDVKDLVKSLQEAGLTADQDSLSFSLHDQGEQAQERQRDQNDGPAGTVVASVEAEEQDPAIIAQTQILELGRLDVRV